MKLEMFINFDGNCREALEFYAKVFKSEIGEVMTYGDAPSDPNYPLNEADRNKICYAGMPVGGLVLMFSDSPTGGEFVKGNNVCPTIGSAVLRLMGILTIPNEMMLFVAMITTSEYIFSLGGIILYEISLITRQRHEARSVVIYIHLQIMVMIMT